MKVYFDVFYGKEFGSSAKLGLRLSPMAHYFHLLTHT